jgi:hypothetical protein
MDLHECSLALLSRLVKLYGFEEEAIAAHRPDLSRDVKGDAPQDYFGSEYYACCTAVNFQAFGPTGRPKVQYSSNSIGSELLPLTTAPVLASTV